MADSSQLKATLRYGEVGVLSDDVDPLGDTGATPAATPDASPLASSVTLSAARTTVLPRRKRSADRPEQRPRFQMLGVLGRGGMGEVALVQDNDINRTVAVKRLLPQHLGGDAMLRFADEVRAVGQLEHPGIVPVYDVDVDDNGQHYLVMKHVRGETLETIIEKLKANEPEYLERFTYEYRALVFLEILEAIRFAHDRGIIHRDIKPANVMIGPFGEVTVMDWGLAKRVDRRQATLSPAATPPAKSSGEGRLLETLHGALVGTPLYMSPEQASGRNDELDERSDIYSLSLLFYELIALEHPLHEHKTLQGLIAALIAKDLDLRAMRTRVLRVGAPLEYLQFLRKGLQREREQRFASVGAMVTSLRDILSGKMRVECHISLTKRIGHELLHWIDRNPRKYTAILV